MVAQDGLDLELGLVGVDLPLPPLLCVRLQGLLASTGIGPTDR